MSEAKRQSIWTWEAYLDWEFRQPIRYKLVEGQVHAMDGRRNTIPSATICANWDDLRREYPELEPEDIRQALEFAARNLDDSVQPLETV